MPGRNLRSTRKGKDPDRDWLKLSEGSPLPEIESDVADVPSLDIPVKVNKKKKRAAAKKQKENASKGTKVSSAQHDKESVRIK